MVKEAIATGATTEEAYEKACAMLGVDPADAEFEVLETEEKKRFGLSAADRQRCARSSVPHRQTPQQSICATFFPAWASAT